MVVLSAYCVSEIDLLFVCRRLKKNGTAAMATAAGQSLDLLTDRVTDSAERANGTMQATRRGAARRGGRISRDEARGFAVGIKGISACKSSKINLR